MIMMCVRVPADVRAPARGRVSHVRALRCQAGVSGWVSAGVRHALAWEGLTLPPRPRLGALRCLLDPVAALVTVLDDAGRDEPLHLADDPRAGPPGVEPHRGQVPRLELGLAVLDPAGELVQAHPPGLVRVQTCARFAAEGELSVFRVVLDGG